MLPSVLSRASGADWNAKWTNPFASFTADDGVQPDAPACGEKLRLDRAPTGALRNHCEIRASSTLRSHDMKWYDPFLAGHAWGPANWADARGNAVFSW